MRRAPSAFVAPARESAADDEAAVRVSVATTGRLVALNLRISSTLKSTIEADGAGLPGQQRYK